MVSLLKHALKDKILWKKIKNSSEIFFFSDFDGTLAPIVNNPDDAQIAQDIQEHLERLVLIDNVRAAIVSGRVLRELYLKIGIPQITYVGTHGMEILSEGKMTVERISDSHSHNLNKTAMFFHKAFFDIKGVGLEIKPGSVALHYRNIKLDNEKEFTNRLTQIMKSNRETFENLQVYEGKKVFEFMPKEAWDKGTAIRSLLTNDFKGLPIYLGDDQTDESAFKVVRQLGISIKIGTVKQTTMAEFYLTDISEVSNFIAQLIDIREKRG